MHDEVRGKKRSVDDDDDDDDRGNGRCKARRTSQYSHSQYTVGWVCALPKEQTAVIAMLDEQHDSLLNPHGDPNAYTLGSIGDHNIVIACLPKGQISRHQRKISVYIWFLLARLYLESLMQTTSVREILSALEKFKQRHADMSGSQHESDEVYDFDRDNVRDVEILASVCAGLVNIDDASQTIRLVHYTTQDYFLRREDRLFPRAHDRMASVYIKYLRFACDELSSVGPDAIMMLPSYYATWAQPLLLEKGASVDAKNNSGQASLVVACKEGNTALLDLLLDKGASVDAEDYYGSTPLLVAVVNGHSSCAYKLLHRGARCRTAEQGHKALTLATRLGDALLVKALLDVGAPVALDASRGRNLLIIAAERDDAEMGHFETASAMIEGGADVQTTDCNGQAPLSLACAFSGGGPGKHLTTVWMLVETGARVNARCHAGCTALFWATRNGGLLRAGEPDDVVRFLISAGADIEFLRRRAQEVGRTTFLRA
ncbi:ankyrin repeat protein [Colletotrichum sojae]|uniref:Ankyrin repeat protein n=1 Tax=Colletotrichum sojae TaxID=2175907 RepID=A0A8H6IUJ5_9PEZI|nr:ankyrin repeat protein [Colletotrichum sojae]